MVITRLYCGARTKGTGLRCRHRPHPGGKSGRCHLHGGRGSGGPPWQKRNIGPAHKARAARQALMRYLGIPWYSGKPKPQEVKTMAEEAKEVIRTAITELEERVPLDVRNLPVYQLTPPQALGRASLAGLHQLIRIIEQPLDLDNIKQQRLIGDMALGANKLLRQNADAEHSHTLIDKLLATLEAEKATQK